MPLILFIMLIIFTTNSAVACDTNKTEDFDKFFSHFAEDKRFAIERTQYPLEKYGIEYKGIGKKSGSEFVEFHVSKSEDSVLPTISKLKKDNLMQYGKKDIFLPNATVDLSNPDESYLLLPL